MDRIPMKVILSGPFLAECPATPPDSPQFLELLPPPGLRPTVDCWSSSASTPGSDSSACSPEEQRAAPGCSPPELGFNTMSMSCHDGERGDADEWRTTLHIRNLPCGFKRHDLMGIVDSWDLAGQYDFVYVPLDFRTRRSLGYAFLNFTNTRAAQIFKKAMHGFAQWSVRSRKACSVEWSQTQGYEANVKVIQKSKVMKLCSEFKPVILANGAMVPCPA